MVDEGRGGEGSGGEGNGGVVREREPTREWFVFFVLGFCNFFEQSES
jgi:hypothetical protein